MKRTYRLAGLIILALPLIMAAPSSSSADPEFTTEVLNVPPNKVDAAALQSLATAVVRLWKDDKLDRARVRIFADHPVVKDTQADQTIRIAINSSKPAVILIPRSHHGSRIVVQQSAGSTDTYALYSAPAEARLQIDGCFKP